MNEFIDLAFGLVIVYVLLFVCVTMIMSILNRWDSPKYCFDCNKEIRKIMKRNNFKNVLKKSSTKAKQSRWKKIWRKIKKVLRIK